MSYVFTWISQFLLVFSSLFAIVNPFAIIPTFLVLTKENSKPQTSKIIQRACLAGAEILIFFQLFGNLVFHVLGIKLDAFKVAGGVLLFLAALDMLKAKEMRDRYSHEIADAEEKADISIVPLATPLLSGPGAITSIIVFTNDPNSTFAESTSIAVVSVALVFAISYYVLKYSVHLKNILGKSGISVMQRIMGILLAAISLQMIIEGMAALVRNFLRV